MRVLPTLASNKLVKPQLDVISLSVGCGGHQILYGLIEGTNGISLTNSTKKFKGSNSFSLSFFSALSSLGDSRVRL